MSAPDEKTNKMKIESVPDAGSLRARYFSAVRTNAFTNLNLVENYVEFWAAIRVDSEKDLWRVMHYMAFGLDEEDGKFVSETITNKDVPFTEALAYLARNEAVANKFLVHTTADVDIVKYPADKYPELRVHYFDLEHYKKAANIEGLAFSTTNDVYARVQGKIFANATFKRSEIAKSILAAEQEQAGTPLSNQMEAGVLGDLFNTMTSRNATLDGVLKVAETLGYMDSFATQVAGFYLSVQNLEGKQKASLKDVSGLTPEERKTVTFRAEQNSPHLYGWDEKARLIRVLQEAEGSLNAAEGAGVYVEPFRKFLAECEVYTHMMYAADALPKLESKILSVNSSDISLVTDIKNSVFAAQTKLKELGGTEEHLDKIKELVLNRDKIKIPPSIPQFLTRYYQARTRVMKSVQERGAAATADASLLPAAVRPPMEDAAVVPKKKAAGKGPGSL